MVTSNLSKFITKKKKNWITIPFGGRFLWWRVKIKQKLYYKVRDPPGLLTPLFHIWKSFSIIIYYIDLCKNLLIDYIFDICIWIKNSNILQSDLHFILLTLRLYKQWSIKHTYKYYIYEYNKSYSKFPLNWIKMSMLIEKIKFLFSVLKIWFYISIFDFVQFLIERVEKQM